MCIFIQSLCLNVLKKPLKKAQRPKKALDLQNITTLKHFCSNGSTDCVVHCAQYKSATVITEILQGFEQITICQSKNSKQQFILRACKI